MPSSVRCVLHTHLGYYVRHMSDIWQIYITCFIYSYLLAMAMWTQQVKRVLMNECNFGSLLIISLNVRCIQQDILTFWDHDDTMTRCNTQLDIVHMSDVFHQLRHFGCVRMFYMESLFWRHDVGGEKSSSSLWPINHVMDSILYSNLQHTVGMRTQIQLTVSLRQGNLGWGVNSCSATLLFTIFSSSSSSSSSTSYSSNTSLMVEMLVTSSGTIWSTKCIRSLAWYWNWYIEKSW